MNKNRALSIAIIAIMGAALLVLGVTLYQATLPDVVTMEKAAVTVMQLADHERHSQEVAIWFALGGFVLTVIAGAICAILANEMDE